MVGPRTQRIVSSVTPVIGVPGDPLIVIGERNSVAFNGSASIGTSSTSVRPANVDRLALILVNDSNNEIYIFEGTPALIGVGGRLNRRGGTAIITNYTGVVTAIAVVAASNLTIIEVDVT